MGVFSAKTYLVDIVALCARQIPMLAEPMTFNLHLKSTLLN